MSGSSQNRESPHFYIVILHAGAVLKDFMPYPAPDGVAADFLRAGDAVAERDVQRISFQGAELIADAPPVVSAQGDAAVLDDRAAVGTAIAPGQHGVRALFHIVLCHAVRLSHGDVAVVHDGTGLIAYHTENGLAILRTDGAILHPDVYKKLGTSELTWENYAPLCRVNTDAAAITVGAKWAADNGITDLPGFIDYCKAHPGEVQMGGSSNASVWHIAGGYLMSATGIDIQMITYQEGAATAVQNAAGGFIQGVTVSLAEARSFIESGDLICLGVMDEERNPVFPDVPTCKEQGYDITYYTQRGMAAPLGVDDAIMTRLEEACAAAIEDPDFVTFMNNNGQAISYLDAQGYADYLKQAAVDVAAAMDAVGL